MAPLIPQGFINPDLNLFFAFVIGLGFGYVLEQGGFSTSRKLAGVFYGYDFVVLRVFFTAAITAALGLLIFSYLGWIDYSMLYINPTFLWSAIVGGVIMGLGFILGGFCPGTSVVAAVIGKVDAMFFVVGMMLGIFAFGSFYEIFEPLYNGYDLGGIFVYDSLGMSRDLFVFLLVLIAFTAFIVTRKIEDSVNKITTDTRFFHPSYTAPFALLLGITLLVVLLPDKPKALWNEVSATTILAEAAEGQHNINSDELAYKLLHAEDNDLLLVDVRDSEAFARFSLPGSVNMPLPGILKDNNLKMLEKAGKKVVFYSNGTTAASQAWLFTRRAGLEGAGVLNGGLNDFFAAYFADSAVRRHDLNPEQAVFYARFRERAGKAFREGGAGEVQGRGPAPVRTLVNIQPPPPGKGGC